MALVDDPDDLSQGLETAVGDAVFTGSSGADTTITSAGSNLPTLAANDFFEVRDHDAQPGNNGLYIATGSPTAGNLPCTKVDGPNPTDSGSEAIRTLGDNGATLEYKSVHIDPGQKRFYLIEQGNLSTDGAIGQAVYSFFKEEWKADADLIRFGFPMTAIGSVAEELELTAGWEARDVAAHSIQTKKLMRTVGWTEYDSTGAIIVRQYSGIVSLGSFEDDVNDNAYYSLGDDPTDIAAAVDFTFAGPVNEAILVYEDYGVPGNLVITGNNLITKSGGTSFITFGFKVGGQVTIQDAEDTGNDGTFVLQTVTADALTVVGTPLTNNADDDTMRLAADNRNTVFPRVRVRDADPKGKTYDASSIPEIGFSIIDNKAFRFPLASKTDQFIDETDANIAANPPYTEIRLRYLEAAYNREVDSATKRNFGIIIDVGTYSKDQGVSNGTTTFTSADWNAGAGETLGDYTGGDLIIHEGTDQGTHTISGTPTAPGGTLTIVLTVALSGSETGLSFTMERATPLTATAKQIYEKVQYQLRQDSDIDETHNVVTGRTADALINFIGLTDVRFGEDAPTNPNGGGSGVIVEGFDANDTNNMFFFDNGGTSRNFPFVAAGTMAWSETLYPLDSDPDYWMFFQYSERTTVTDFAISAASGDTASFDSAGANLPTVVQNDYVALSDMTNEENNGIWIVTDATPTTSQFDARKVDGQTVVNEGAASHPLDLDPADSPQAIVVNDNGGSPIQGAIAAATTAFDFDYDGNSQGGRTPATDANIVIKAMGLEDAVYAEALGVITRNTGLQYSVVSPLERNYDNP
jgi:hypothetical protein